MAAHRSRVMMSFAATAVAALGVAVSVLRVSAQAPVVIPKEGDGYQITQPSSSKSAPDGFEGRTETSTLTAVGNTPATMGKRVVAKFVFSNEIRTCPAADGVAEGEGLFSVTVDSTDVQANGTSTLHIDMRAKAKYKGQVNDDAYLDGPVKAEIDYTYTQSGTMRGANGALATPAGTNVTQHVTVPFVVPPGASSAPTVGALAGGDPTHGQLSEAFSVGTALAYWAGVYYSVAQTKWRTGRCVEISYTPPENTLQPALGTSVTVKALVKTKRGESVPAKFIDAHAFQGASVTPAQGRSTDASPALPFTYTAPSRKPSNPSLAGFQVGATSRAGITEKAWHTNLGTGWSGQISCLRETRVGPYSYEQQSGSNYFVTRIVIEVKDGVGTATGYSEINSMGVNLRPVARQGYVFDNSSSIVGAVEGTRPATIDVALNATTGAYRINPEYRSFELGKQRAQQCSARDGCREQELTLGIESCLSGLSGTTTSPNQLHGSINDVKTTPVGSHSSTQSLIVNWDLSRQGTAK